jgi:DNA repair photolyase
MRPILASSETPPPAPRKGRGALGNREGRYERLSRTPVDDGWWQDTDAPPPLPTLVSEDQSRTVIRRNTSPDVPFDRAINPYQGCEHGCVYCFARPTHAYLGLSAGLDFETKLYVKKDAARLLAAELRRKRYRAQPLMLGSNTDPYQPLERKLRITRAILEVLSGCEHPVAIATKSPLVVRDLDILAPMAGKRLVSVGVSVTTLDPALARKMEPRAGAPAKRLSAIRALADAGVPVSVLAAPVIPFINDHELERILEAAAAAGASAASRILLRLPWELKELFEEWLRAHFPDRAERVLACVRDCHGGNLYDARWGERMRGSGPWADLLHKRFDLACRRLGLATGSPATRALDCSRFRPPAEDCRQGSLL